MTAVPFVVDDPTVRLTFLRNTFLTALDALTEESRPLWGVMSAQHMLEHLIWGFELSTGRIATNRAVPERLIARAKPFLFNDSPTPHLFKNPLLGENPPPFRFPGLEEAKRVLREECHRFIDHAHRNPTEKFVHPIFGPLDADEWQRAHFKHCYHHLLQFGLISEASPEKCNSGSPIAQRAEFQLRATRPDDHQWVETLLRQHWGSSSIVTNGNLRHADELPGIVAVDAGGTLGLLTYSIEGNVCEIVTLNSLRKGQGVGSALIRQTESIAREAGCVRMIVVTTNDNVGALRFYQKRGFELVALRRNAVTHARALKPEIPTVGDNEIPIRDELELQRTLP